MPPFALFLFTKSIIVGKPIDVFNHGKMKRDFTYVADIVEGVFRLITHVPIQSNSRDAVHSDPSSSSAPYKIFNISNNQPVELSYFIASIEKSLGKKAINHCLVEVTGVGHQAYR